MGSVGFYMPRGSLTTEVNDNCFIRMFGSLGKVAEGELSDEIFGNPMMPAFTQSDDLTVLHEPIAPGLGEVCIAHPTGTFAVTPASLISLKAIADIRSSCSADPISSVVAISRNVISTAGAVAVRPAWCSET